MPPRCDFRRKLRGLNREAGPAGSDGIAIESMESETFSAITGKGKTVSYTMKLKGSRAEGQLHVMLHSAGGEMKIVSMVLTGPDNERYNLTAPQTGPSNSI